MNPLTACPPDDVLLSSLDGAPDLGAELSHLEQCERCQQRLSQLRQELKFLSTVCFLPTDKLDFEPGKQIGGVEPEVLPHLIGRYRVIGELQGGGQSRIFRVAHPTLEVELIAKLGKDRLSAGDRSRDLLLAEGKRLAEISHPQIARVMDMDIHDNHPFIIMEYVRGMTLRKLSESRKLSPAESTTIIRQIAEGLQAAHDHAVVHQDLKPDNIIIESNGHPKIIDFGIALNFGAWCDETRTGHRVAGTLGYMAPEQAEGDVKKVDARSDVFNLGAILFELLTGDTPFLRGPTMDSLAASKECLIDFSKLQKKGISHQLIQICKRALAKDRDSRFKTAAEFATALSGYERRRELQKRAIGLAASMVLLSPLSAWFLFPSRTVTSAVPPAEMSVKVFRGESVFDLSDSVPLSESDEIQIEVRNIPSQHSPGLILIGSEGTLKFIPSNGCRVIQQGDHQSLLFPKDGRLQTLDHHAGTECILFVSSKSSPMSWNDELLKPLLNTNEWPSLGEQTVLKVTSDRVEYVARGRGFGADVRNDNVLVKDRLEMIRAKLLERFDSVSGVAFPHVTQ